MNNQILDQTTAQCYNLPMIRPTKLLSKFESQQLATPISVPARIALMEAMYWHAVELGAFPLQDPLAGIEHDIERTRKIHTVRSTVKSPS